MAKELKTRPTNVSVEKFLDAIPDEARRDDCYAVLRLMQKITNAEPTMWGTAIVGFGSYHYKYASGQEADWPVAAFSPRKQNLTLYLMPGFEQYKALMNRLGTYKTSKACLYLKRLSDVDQEVLEALIRKSVADVKKTHP